MSKVGGANKNRCFNKGNFPADKNSYDFSQSQLSNGSSDFVKNITQLKSHFCSPILYGLSQRRIRFISLLVLASETTEIEVCGWPVKRSQKMNTFNENHFV